MNERNGSSNDDDSAGAGSVLVMEVRIEEVRNVKPWHMKDNKTHNIYLSSLDLFWREFPYNRRLLFYNPPPTPLSCNDSCNQVQDCIVQKLELSLSQTLDLFYPLTGRLSSDAHGRPCIDCDPTIGGVEFVVASACSTLSQAFPDRDFSPCPAFDKLVASIADGNPPLDPDHLTLLSIQVTKFSCGGLSLGFAHSHVVADEHSMWHFMNSWAEIARGDPISSFPMHDRTFFKIDKPCVEIARLINLPLPQQYGIVIGEEQEPDSPQLVEKLFHVRNAELDRLQNHASSHPDMSRPFNSYELICAHLWKHVAQARHLEEADNIVRLSVFGDMRFRVNPPLGKAYFGNGIMFALANSTSHQLKSMDLGTIAYMIHNTINDCNEVKMWSKIHWLNVFGDRIQWEQSSMMNIVSSPKFKVYGVDFGWGKPVSVRPASVRRDGELILFPSSCGGIDVCMALPQPTMERLLQDVNFLPIYYHSNVCTGENF